MARDEAAKLEGIGSAPEASEPLPPFAVAVNVYDPALKRHEPITLERHDNDRHDNERHRAS
jgi:hypothetical protein